MASALAAARHPRVRRVEDRDGALEALRALELDRDKLDPAVYARQRHELLAAGASALQALEAAPALPDATKQAIAALEADRARLGDAAVNAAIAALRAGAPRTAPAPAAAPGALSPAWVGAAYAFGAMGLLALLYFFAQSGSAPRAPGGVMTGGGPMGSGGGEAPAMADDPATAELRARLAANPNDLEALNDLTEYALGQEDLGTAMSMNSRALAIDPKNADARVYLAFLRTAIGQGELALTELDQLLVEQPGHTKALVYKGLIAMIIDRPDLAIAPLEQALAGEAAGNPFLEERLAVARARASGEEPPPQIPLGGPEPRPAPMAAPAPAAGGDLVLSGTATLPSSLAAQLAGTEVLYVSVKDPAGGPPLAALKLPPGPFPVAFTVTTANAIAMGGARPFPPVVAVTVRIDADGNPMTRSDAEPAATMASVALGSTGLTFDLK